MDYFQAFFSVLLTLPGEQSTQRRLVPIRPAQTTVTKKRKGICGSFQQTLVGEERVTSPQESAWEAYHQWHYWLVTQ